MRRVLQDLQKDLPEVGDLGLEVYHSVHYLERLIKEGKIKFKGELGKKVTIMILRPWTERSLNESRPPGPGSW